MKKLLALPCCLFMTATLFAQNRTTDFEITLPEQKTGHSLYKTISYIDSRYDTTHMGIVQLGAFNAKARVVPKIPFSIQLTNVLNAFTDSTAKEGELLLQLWQLNFAEITGQFSEKGYCYLRAVIYAKASERYQKLSTIDTVILVKSMDVTKGLFRNGSQSINSFIGNSLLQTPNDSISYSYNEVVHMDSIEKRKLPVYNTATYKDGIYKDFVSFSKQVPDITEMKVALEGGQLTSVKIPGENGKLTNIKSKDLYAVVYNGVIFVATDYGYYPVEKRHDDFFFIGKAKVSLSTGDAIAAGMFFGLMGTLLAAEAANATFEMKIDHSNGGFMRLREIKQYNQ